MHCAILIQQTVVYSVCGGQGKGQIHASGERQLHVVVVEGG